jgi:RES domain-containing protein
VPPNVDGVAVTNTWWRQVPAGRDPYDRPAPPPDGRWQRGSVVEALYFADSSQTAWAEWYRVLAEFGVPPMAALPRDLWKWRISLSNVANLSSAAHLSRVGLPMPTPSRHSWRSFQTVGESIARAHYPGLVAPSAARPSAGLVLCVFRTSHPIEGAEALPPPEHHDQPPVPPVGLTT